MGLTRKILLFTSAIVVALAASTLVFTTVQANRLAQATIAEGLSETRAFWSTFEADRYAKLRLGLRVLANDPYFKAGIERAFEINDEATTLDMLRERGEDLKADFFIATNADGKVLARSDRAGAAGEDLSAEPVVEGALEGEGAATVWRQGNGLFHAVSVPMTTGPELKGVLVSGYRLDEALAHQLRRLTHADIAFLVREAGGARRLVASSLASREPDLSAALSQLRPAAGEDTAPFEIGLAGERWAGIELPLRAGADEPLGSVLALRSHAREMAPFLQFRRSLIVVSVTVMALALALAFLGAARIANPVRRLVALVERARDGSYTGAVAVDSRDEIGVLARAFNNLLADLREKEQLIGFLREGLTLSEQQLRDTQAAATAVQLTNPPTGVSAALTIGGVFADRYEIKSLLGRGGMGAVYLAHDRQLDEPVALKVVRAEVLQQDATLLQRFKLEIRLARKITHRNVLRTHDFGEAAGVPYISMEYVEGVTLKDLVRSRGALPLGVGLRIAKQMCLGLEAAHAEGVVHRDIKPQNMLIIPETGDVKIMDFGIARVSERDSEVTSTGVVLGTPSYMPPEQAQGKAADFRSDIYSLGIVLYEVFCGRLPFSGDTPVAVMMQQVQAQPPSPRALNPKLTPALEAVILKCLQKDPARRYARAGDLLAALTELSSQAEAEAA